jgi:hypothetical protein
VRAAFLLLVLLWTVLVPAPSTLAPAWSGGQRVEVRRDNDKAVFTNDRGGQRVQLEERRGPRAELLDGSLADSSASAEFLAAARPATPEAFRCVHRIVDRSLLLFVLTCPSAPRGPPPAWA